MYQFTFLAICLGGCEDEVKADIMFHMIRHGYKTIKVDRLEQSQLDNNLLICSNDRLYYGESGCGKLLLTICDDKGDENGLMSYIYKIRSVQYWMLYISHNDGIPIELNDCYDFFQS